MAFTSSVVNALSRRGGLVCEKANPFIFVSESVTRKKKLGGGRGVHHERSNLENELMGISGLRAENCEKITWRWTLRTGATSNVANPNKCISQKKSLGESKNSKFGAHQVFKMTSL